jgi:hypothetical protein
MPKFRLHVDEMKNVLNFVEIEMPGHIREADALITKIEEEEVTSTLDLKRKLESQGIKVTSFSINNKSFYRKTVVLEIEELEEPQKQEPIFQCRVCDLTKESIERAIDELREKMYASIDKNERQADATIKVSKDLDVLIVSHMKMQLEGR